MSPQSALDNQTPPERGMDIEKPIASEPPSSTDAPPTIPPPVSFPPPNGGTRAWLQVLGAFFLNFNTWGLINSYGVFQSEYATGLLRGQSQSNISWIGSIQAFLMLIVGVLCGRALDAGYYYADILLRVLLEVFGMMITSICKTYWQLVLAQGIVVGIGAGMVFIPGVAIVGTYFSTRRSTAQGLAAVGSCVGGIIYPITLKYLLRNGMGLAWSVRIMGFIMLATLAISVAVMKPRLPPRKSGPLIDWALFRDDHAMSIFLVAVFLTFTGLYVPFFYIEQYAISRLGLDDLTAFLMLIALNVASIPGRIAPSILADHVGNLSIIIPAVLATGIVTLAWIAVTDKAGIIVVAVLLGIANGSIQAVLPSTVSFLCPDLSKLGTNIGLMLFTAGLGILIGTPVAGAILTSQSPDTGGANFTGTLIFSGITTLVGSILLAVVRYLRVGLSLTKA